MSRPPRLTPRGRPVRPIGSRGTELYCNRLSLFCFLLLLEHMRLVLRDVCKGLKKIYILNFVL